MNELTLQRFWSKVVKTSECWNWIASKRNKGYGAFVWCSDGEVVQGRAHRFSWEIHNGKVPDGMCVLHRCDNPACVRPDHLFIGTIADNNRDMRTKGRRVPPGTHGPCNWARGERHRAARLSEGDVHRIRRERASGLSYSQIAARNGIYPAHACKICTGRLWRHLPIQP
jgi:hypothetical protein